VLFWCIGIRPRLGTTCGYPPPSYPAVRSKRWLEGWQDIQPLNPAGTLGNNQLASRVLIEIAEGQFITLVSQRPPNILSCYGFVWLARFWNMAVVIFKGYPKIRDLFYVFRGVRCHYLQLLRSLDSRCDYIGCAVFVHFVRGRDITACFSLQCSIILSVTQS
jgi:hypothetical protein